MYKCFIVVFLETEIRRVSTLQPLHICTHTKRSHITSIPRTSPGSRGFESHLRQPIFLWKMAVSGELCCVVLPFYCVALPFSASWLFIHVHVPVDIIENDIRNSVECVFLEVVFLEVWVHVQAWRPKMVCPRDIWYDTLPLGKDKEKQLY